MVLEEIAERFRRAVCEQIALIPEGLNRARVYTPFRFDDGDHLAIVLRQGRDGWELTDEGHTYMRLTYLIDEADLHHGTRQTIIQNALSMFSVEEHEGALVLPAKDAELGDALYSFIQVLLKISDVSFLAREIVYSTFLEDFRQLFETGIPNLAVQFNWHDPKTDPNGRYVVDCRIDRGSSDTLSVFALPNDDKVKDAIITIQRLEMLGIVGQPIGIFENQEDIGRSVLARFSDVCGKQFSSLKANEDRIKRYVARAS